MPIPYTLENKTFKLSYSELRAEYKKFCAMSDSDFMDNLKDALHLSCIICYLKEVPAYVCLSDVGIVHQLVHLLDTEPMVELAEVRREFEEVLKLS